ncbi:isocitrate/isopropylmalate family dehydrogenase, partial [Sporosarcina sp. P17b]|uniref:isocitrate/isopropylmalate family dehydrogenase n=1 Tax=Sporosarcina sp. P17b TaxID=2048260 RepID=UPI002100B625
RKQFDQYVNIRPIQLLNGAPCPIDNGTKETIDMLFIRENSEGEYAGAGDWLFKGKPEEVVLQTGVFSRKGTERIIRYAFETASNLGIPLLDSIEELLVTKSVIELGDLIEDVLNKIMMTIKYEYWNSHLSMAVISFRYR